MPTQPTPNPTDKPATPTYLIEMTEEEILLLEETLFDRANVLTSISDEHHYKGRRELGRRMDDKVKALETLARKITKPYDEEKIKNA